MLENRACGFAKNMNPHAVGSEAFARMFDINGHQTRTACETVCDPQGLFRNDLRLGLNRQEA